MKTIKIVALIGALCLLGASRVEAEEPCKSLHGATLDVLISYLDKAHPNDGNAECVTYAIVGLGRERYEPAMPALAKWLGYRRPLTRDVRNRREFFGCKNVVTLGLNPHPIAVTIAAAAKYG
jgi:hypothetical protein